MFLLIYVLNIIFFGKKNVIGANITIVVYSLRLSSLDYLNISNILLISLAKLERQNFIFV